MPIQVTAQKEILVGSKLVVEGVAPEGTFIAIFEDDQDTAYFYAVDTTQENNPIQDALHIYNVKDVTDRTKPSVVKIGWSQDSKKVVLLINGHPHAIFDFMSKQGYCRTGFPPPAENSNWGSEGHAWQESAIELFA